MTTCRKQKKDCHDSDLPLCGVIDVHTHILPDEIPDWDTKFGRTGFVRLESIKGEITTDKNMVKGGKFFRRVECNCIDPLTRVSEMKKSSVDVQVLSTVPIMFHYWATSEQCLETSRYINDHLSKVCAENPTKFVGLGTVPMQDIDLACTELRRCVKDLKLKGVEIGTHVNGKNLDDVSFDKFWKTVEELDAVVFVHPWDMMGGDRMEKHWLSWLVSMPAETTTAISCMIFGGVYKKYPKLKVYYAHGGGSLIGTVERIQRGFDCRPDLYPNKCSPKEYLKHIKVDALTHDPDTLHMIVSKLGADNVMVGSDYPFPLGEPEDVGRSVRRYVAKYKAHNVYRKLMYENASKFFNITVDGVDEYTDDKPKLNDSNIDPIDPVVDLTDYQSDDQLDDQSGQKRTLWEEPPYMRVMSPATSPHNLSQSLPQSLSQNISHTLSHTPSRESSYRSSSSVKSLVFAPRVVVFDKCAFVADPIYHANQLSVPDLVAILQTLCTAYHVEAKPLVDDSTYDKMVSVLRTRDMHNGFFTNL
ncbi:2-amino-3-carboxymuconate-6-semialdehyde decarboxylase [Yasminevirus sp. GU-2018]|uniref:2-amino-3-carboxymuconate-6-semialdehyde decarboxylase n=1 Tax=Yasminevirus sp. GU-2018 TaxID=2420051 RepID=A0A5K0U925_9VIRU|nr:2-amino-3-carboxymuconate-6-semialdehyde decarboxylase [Yasminevirus sp. GU-2018]